MAQKITTTDDYFFKDYNNFKWKSIPMPATYCANVKEIMQ